jgi:uncharacterized protein YqeY
MREAITAAMKDAMKSGDKVRVGALRLINAAFKDRDIEARGAGKEKATDDELLALLQKMIKQRDESAKIYEANGRAELAAQERAEIAVIQNYLPKQMDEAEARAAIQGVIAETGASSVKDMGKVMGALKEKYAGQMDFGRANGVVKELLS